jgi:peptidoglycan/LPS O-acetylase OafA/YrhL
MLRWVILGVFLAAANRALTLLAVAGVSPYRLMYGTDTRADSLLMGCAVAIAMAPELRPSAARARHLIKYAAWLGVVSLAALGSLGLNPGSSYDFDLGVVYFAVSLFAALIIWEVVLSERGLLATLLAQPFLVYIGRISYGLYLWHYPIFCSVAGTGWSHGKQLLVALPLTGAATLASYYLVERPILRYKQRFSA